MKYLPVIKLEVKWYPILGYLVFWALFTISCKSKQFSEADKVQVQQEDMLKEGAAKENLRN
ncbi:MAG: hypothetical protein ABJC55_14200, partial [Algoriphagus sp.]